MLQRGGFSITELFFRGKAALLYEIVAACWYNLLGKKEQPNGNDDALFMDLV